MIGNGVRYLVEFQWFANQPVKGVDNGFEVVSLRA